MVAHTIAALREVPRLAAVYVVVSHDDRWFEPMTEAAAVTIVRRGGATRAESVAGGLDALVEAGARDDDWVLVHDAARCLIEPSAVDRLIDACLHDAVGGLLALPVADTLKAAAGDQRVSATIDREAKWAAQTPQMFRVGLLREALSRAGDAVTDESSAVEALGHAPKLVAGDAGNFKLTYADDFVRAERALAALEVPMTTIRIGEGWDIHALVTGRPLILGGVTIPHDQGLDGHSDADALAHAITDALLGAAALGDIGRLFPDTDAQYKGADSMVMLAEAARRVRAAGFEIGNIDGTIVAQAPKMAPHIPAMRERLAAALGLTLAQVNVKAKTAERMGPVGEGRAIEARAACLLERAAVPGLSAR
jgi:2-C-methyl-D-erythritol 4-phosphate cytidylyltransferase/2-C-methyl-D-erythritol 2,4-cyclodiphosphate synthase